MKAVRGGFTLIELMIVIAIIAIIAAIAIPGLLQSQRASNERNASASLKTLATGNYDFKTNDRDGNKFGDFWVRDVSGLYTAYPPQTTSLMAIKLIDLSIAAADTTNVPDQATTASSPGTTLITAYLRSGPKAGYWYYAMASDVSSGTAAVYGTDTDGNSSRLWHNNSGFGFGAFPDSFGSGRNVFVINEANTMFKRQTISTVRSGSNNPPSDPFPQTGGFVAGSGTAANWPSITSLAADYGKMD